MRFRNNIWMLNCLFWLCGRKNVFWHHYDTNLHDFELNSGNKFLCLFLLFVHSYLGSLSVTELYQKKQFIGCENS